MRVITLIALSSISVLSIPKAPATSLNSDRDYNTSTKGFLRSKLLHSPGENNSNLTSKNKKKEMTFYNLDARFEFNWNHQDITLDSVFYGKYQSQYSDHKEEATRDKLTSNADVREIYLSYESESWLYKLGRQQVSWGKGDYFRVVDIINPLDLREGLLTYLDDYSLGRIPREMAIIEHYADIVEWQFIAAAGKNQTQYAPSGSDFSIENLPNIKPKNKHHIDFGVRARFFIDNPYITSTDIDIFLFNGKSSDVQFELEGEQLRARLSNRSLIGTSIATPLSLGVLRLDLAYYTKEPLQLIGRFETIKKIDALIGLDIQEKEWNWNLQVSAGKLIKVPNDYRQNKFTYNASASIQKDWSKLRLSSTLTWLFNYQDHASYLVKYFMRYDWYNDTSLEAGIILFEGHYDSQHGRYDDQDRLYVNIKYTFDL